jgi:hypothetical protein
MVRNMESAGVSRERARRISGHKTDSVNSRYNIVNEADLEDAGRRRIHWGCVSARIHSSGDVSKKRYGNWYGREKRAKRKLMINKAGEVREWPNRAVSKTAVWETGPWVRIPPSPPRNQC